MNSEPIFIENEFFGDLYQVGRHKIFFASRLASDDWLKQKFTEFSFRKLKQTHSSICVRTVIADENNAREADSQWTTDPNCALVISTADCLPIVVAHAKFALAIHAGWRGVQSEIIIKSIKAICSTLSLTDNDISQADAFIGPHIQHQSFEVDLGLAEEFQRLHATYAIKNSERVFYPHMRPKEKAYIDLSAVARAQIQSCGILGHRIYSSPTDTYTSADHASYRRDRSPGRNFSFVARRLEKE